MAGAIFHKKFAVVKKMIIFAAHFKKSHF